ncbi:MAG TPA: phytoene desaturase family protein [Ignavibacteriaceae bacterium]|nr:phytoene desaturase family protein [Ignavibacteriaceae bacterium]
MKKRIAVIGGGLGGLSAAIRLAVTGFDVHLFEQNSIVGGKAGSLNIKDFRFDTGPSLLTMPFVLEELINFAGENIGDYIKLKPLDIVCKYFYPDGTVLNTFSKREELINELSKKLGESSGSINKYLDYSKRIYDLTAELFLFNSFSEPKTFLNKKALKTLFNLPRIDPFRTMHQANSSFFKNPKTVQLFDRYATYNGSNPYMAPATLNIIQHVEYNLGAFVPEKGINSIPETLHKIASKIGVKIHFNSKVKSIVTNENSVTGIVVENTELQFDAVVSNADVNYTYNNLLAGLESRQAEKYKSLEPSSSAIVFYWGVKGIHKEFEVHNILFSSNYKKEFEDIFIEQKCSDDPTIYIYVSSKYNPGDAPDGCENWFVMINAPYNKGQNWDNEINTTREKILNKIESVLKKEIRSNIICESILDPVKIEINTSSKFGSLYGISSNNKYAAFLRQRNRSKEFKGLYFCGGSAHPGGGIPLVLLSGKIAAELAAKDLA